MKQLNVSLCKENDECEDIIIRTTIPSGVYPPHHHVEVVSSETSDARSVKK